VKLLKKRHEFSVKMPDIMDKGLEREWGGEGEERVQKIS
jgi:hypothetical protein